MNLAAYMARAVQLAKLAGTDTQSNPMVGAVIVHDNQIIGEGYHVSFGGPHAEVNAINNVQAKHLHLLPQSTIFVTLEPCNHFGKTPPCVNRILESGIQHVVIGCTDPNPQMSGKSIEKLRKHGCKVSFGILGRECKQLIQPFEVLLSRDRPYVHLKFAKSKDNFIGISGKQVWLSNSLVKVYTHHLRSQLDAIMIGTNTALIDNPSLTTREVDGPSPIRVILDRTGRIPSNHTLYTDPAVTWTYSYQPNSLRAEKHTFHLGKNQWSLQTILQDLRSKGVNHLMVEGGASLLNAFILDELWDEAHVMSTTQYLGSGIKAPNIDGRLVNVHQFRDNTCHHISRL